MYIGAADTEGADSRPQWSILVPAAGQEAPLPALGAGYDIERSSLQVDLGINAPKMKRCRNGFMLQRQCGLDKRRYSGACIQMTDVGFQGTDADRAYAGRRIHFGQAGDLDRIAHHRPRPVRFNIRHALGSHVGHCHRPSDHLRLPLYAGRGIAYFAVAVIIAGRSPNDGVDAISVPDSVLKRFSTTIPAPLPSTVPTASRSKGRQWPSGELIRPSWPR